MLYEFYTAIYVLELQNYKFNLRLLFEKISIWEIAVGYLLHMQVRARLEVVSFKLLFTFA